MTDNASEEREPVGRAEGRIGSTVGMRLLAALVRITPRWVVDAFSSFPVIWYYVAWPEGRRASAQYQRMLGSDRGAVGTFLFGLRQAWAYSQVILDNLYLGIRGAERFDIVERGTEMFRALLEEGNGLILLSAHAGNWHLAVNFLSNVETRIHLVTEEARQEEVRRQMDRAKVASEHLVVHAAEAGLELVFALKAALEAGEVVILAGDRVTGGRSLALDFLGGRAAFPVTAFSLAATTRSPICTALPFRTGTRHYTCYGLGPYRGETARDKAEEFVGDLERLLREYPEQWFNFYEFWEEDDAERGDGNEG